MPQASEPSKDCPLCPRLVAFRLEARAREPDWHNAPVPSFGRADAPLLVVGLAPGLKGANRTGRPFTGDYAGDLLYATMHEFGFANGRFAARVDDGLVLHDARVTNGVRCVPPANKPTPAEITTCRQFLLATLAEASNLRAIVALGRIAHETVLRSVGARLAAHPFAHAARHELVLPSKTIALFDSYHCSRYNTNTGVLTVEMFRKVFAAARAYVDETAFPSV